MYQVYCQNPSARVSKARRHGVRQSLAVYPQRNHLGTRPSPGYSSMRAKPCNRCVQVSQITDLQTHRMCGTGHKQGEDAEVYEQLRQSHPCELKLLQIDITGRCPSQWIVRLIHRVFFIEAESGVARKPGTHHYFDPLRAETIYYMVTCLAWCMKEYSTGFWVRKDTDKEFERKQRYPEKYITNTIQSSTTASKNCGSNSTK